MPALPPCHPLCTECPQNCQQSLQRPEEATPNVNIYSSTSRSLLGRLGFGPDNKTFVSANGKGVRVPSNPVCRRAGQHRSNAQTFFKIIFSFPKINNNTHTHTHFCSKWSNQWSDVSRYAFGKGSVRRGSSNSHLQFAYVCNTGACWRFLTRREREKAAES